MLRVPALLVAHRFQWSQDFPVRPRETERVDPKSFVIQSSLLRTPPRPNSASKPDIRASSHSGASGTEVGPVLEQLIGVDARLTLPLKKVCPDQFNASAAIVDSGQPGIVIKHGVYLEGFERPPELNCAEVVPIESISVDSTDTSGNG